MKKIVGIILIFLIIMTNIYPVFAVPRGAIGSARGESGHKPPTSTPSDSPQPSLPSTPVTENKDTVKYTTILTDSYEYIEGNVVEDLGEVYNTQNRNEGGIDSEKATLPIKDVFVKLYGSDGSVRTKRTDGNGNWKFENLPNGEYKVEYYFGILGSEIDPADKNAVKNILKYNGQDYLVSYVTKGGSYSNRTITESYTQETWEIQENGNGVTQVMIALDCSWSMRSEKIKIADEQKTKIEIAAEATSELIHKLLDGTNSIYIGLVFFSGDNYRAVSLTRNEEELKQALNDVVTNGWQAPNTDVQSGLDKALDSFVSKTENRYIVLMSDGFPTKAGDVEIYIEDSQEEVENKLEYIEKATRNKVQKILQNKINFISLFTLPNETDDDKEIREWIREIYGDFGDLEKYNNFNIVDANGNQFDKTITGKIKEHIEETSETTKKEETKNINVARGYEDFERSKEIDKNFKSFNYKNTSLFDIIEGYDGSPEDINKAKELSSKTYGYVHGGSGYVIEKHDESECKPKEYIYQDADGKQYTYGDKSESEEGYKLIEVITYQINHTGYKEDMNLAKKPSFLLGINLDTTGYEVILQNGTEFLNKKLEIGNDDILVESMDEKMAFGSEIKTTFTGRVKNETKIKLTSMRIICYVPKWVTLRKMGGEQYNLQEIPSLEVLYNNGYLADDPYNTYADKKAYLLTFNDKTNFKGAINTYEFKIQCDLWINEFDDLDEVNCIAELLEYSNEANRRMTQNKYTQINGKYVEALKTMYPGNNIERTEVDWSEARSVSIIPETGLTKEMKIKNNVVRILLLILTILAIVIITLLLKTIKKKNK